MSEPWPPEWGDPEDTEDLDTEQSDTGHPDSEPLHPDVLAEYLSEVTSALASAPVPALPDAFEARISAAIATEAATRTEHTGAIDVSATARSLSSESFDGSFPAAADSGAATAPHARSRLIRKALRLGNRNARTG